MRISLLCLGLCALVACGDQKELQKEPDEVDGAAGAVLPDSKNESFATYVRGDTVEVSSESAGTIRVVPEKNWEKLIELLSRTGAVVEKDANRLLVDESKISDEGELQRFDDSGESTKVKGVCMRTPFGPGLVKWWMSNPAGQGFSRKPESSWALTWAQAPEQDCDGIYNRRWGCGRAFKVPDSCTAVVNSYGGLDCCCNVAMAQFGIVCQWKNPVELNWPVCPL